MIVAKAGKLAYKLLQGREVCGTAFPVKNCTYIVCEGGQVIAIYERGPSLPFGICANVRPQGSVSMCAREIVWKNGKADWKLEKEQIAEYELLDEEKTSKTAHQKIYVEHPLPTEPRLQELLFPENERGLEKEIDSLIKKSDAEVKEWLHQLVSNYTPQE